MRLAVAIRARAVLAFCLLDCVATYARADGDPDPSVDDEPATVHPDDDDAPRFWGSVLSPHAAEVTRLVDEGSALRDRAMNAFEPQEARQRARLLTQAQHCFARAAALEPHADKVLRELAFIDAALGDHLAVVTLVDGEAGLRDTVLDDRPLFTTLATSLIKLGRGDEAAELLERGLAHNAPGDDLGALYGLLGYADMVAGRLEDAVAAYERALRVQPPNGDILALNGLAVAYDRDEQVGRAAEVLEQVREHDPELTHLMHQPSANVAQVPFSPPADRHYWLALGYESQRRLPEAAAAWRAYLAAPTPPFRRRAEEHLREVEARLAKRPPSTKKARP